MENVLVPTKSAKLKMVLEDKIPHKVLGVAYTPDSLKDSNQNIQDHLGDQNSDLNVTEWRFHNKKKEDKITLVKFAVDCKTAATMRRAIQDGHCYTLAEDQGQAIY